MIEIRPDTQNKTVFISISNATFKVRKGLKNALIEIGKENVRHTKALIRKQPKTGRFYGKHRASAPGEPPANRTGKLLRSVRYKSSSWSFMEFGDSAPYGKFLEDGTKKMRPRPHLKRTVREKSRDNFNSIAKAVDDGIKK